MNHNCTTAGHVLQTVNPIDGTRTCALCGTTLPATGTFEVKMAPGSLERYPAGLFTGSDGSQIRRFLQVKKGDILLHNWHDGCLYVFRNTTNRVETLENEKMVLNARIAELEETLRNKNFEQK